LANLFLGHVISDQHHDQAELTKLYPI
jgi:hypothetical protein